MGRPIKKKWFGSEAGKLKIIADGNATKVIKAQKGTGKFLIADGRILTLTNKTSGLTGNEGYIGIDAGAGMKPVKKLTANRAYFFDGSDSVVWNNADDTAFAAGITITPSPSTPALLESPEPVVQAPVVQEPPKKEPPKKAPPKEEPVVEAPIAEDTPKVDY